MKARTAILIALAACLLLGGAALRQAQSAVLAQASGPPGPAQYVVAQGAASGGGYRLTGQTWQVRGVADGGGYRLAVSLSPAGTGTPCCCIYLPCALRNYH
jgi:hypothetical protein